MRKLISFIGLLLVLASFNALAVDVFVDPTKHTKFVLECDDPVIREDGVTPLAPEEIARRTFFVDQGGSWIDVHENTIKCELVIDATKLSDGVYLYTVTFDDVDDRESEFSKADDLENGLWRVTVKRQAPPGTATNPRVRLLL